MLFTQWLLHSNLFYSSIWVLLLILLSTIYCYKLNVVGDELEQINKKNGSFVIQEYGKAQQCFISAPVSFHHSLRRHHRWRRAPAVWGDPAPDYSLAALDPRSNIYLYALLFVDLKTSDHYRRDHMLVKREVMRLAKEANNYFYQINLRLIVVDVLETFRDDLSLYTFELYRNSRMAQLPFHDFAVLISYRYAGGLAFVGGMCNSKSVMLAGFYPHNPEAMASIFFHEVAHLIGVPHRPENETLDVPNCACNNLNSYLQKQNKLETKSSVVNDRRLASAGCLKIPGFDQDCTLQLMVNMAMRTRCLLREPKAEAHTSSLAICGNGVHEEGEQCDCGLADKCNQWNCQPEKCIRRWPVWAVWLLAIFLSLVASGPFLLWILFPCSKLSYTTSQRWSVNKRRYYHYFLPIPPFIENEKNNNKLSSNETTNNNKIKEINNQYTQLKTTQFSLIEWLLSCRIRAFWERIKWIICSKRIGRRQRKRLKTHSSAGSQSCDAIRRPNKPPPPPPHLNKNLCYSSNTLNRPKRPPPLLPSLPTTSSGTYSSLIRPKIFPPSPPPSCKEINNNNIEEEFNQNLNQNNKKYLNEDDYDERRWNDDFDDD